MRLRWPALPHQKIYESKSDCCVGGETACDEYLASLTRTTRPSKPTQKMSQIKNTCCGGTATVCDEYLPRRRADGSDDDDAYGFPACVKDCSVACLQDGDETCADDCSTMTLRPHALCAGIRLRRELAIALLGRCRRRYPHADGGPEPHTDSGPKPHAGSQRRRCLRLPRVRQRLLRGVPPRWRRNVRRRLLR